MSYVQFSEIKLCTYAGNLKKKWFIAFTATSKVTGEKKRFQFRGDINLYNNKKERLIEAAALKHYWKEEIKNGWSPFAAAPDLQTPALNHMRLNEALDFALARCSVAKKTKSCYGCSVRFFKSSAEKLSLHRLLIGNVKRQHVKIILEDVRVSRKWSNKAYNRNLGFLQAVFSQLIEWEAIEYNPSHKIKNLKTVETQKYIPLTEEEKTKVREYFFLHCYRYLVILMIIYHTGIRPKEILSLLIEDVDLLNAEIIIQPDLETENSKTTNIRRVPINRHLLPFLRELHLEDHPRKMYVFGSPFVKGEGNRGRGVLHPDYFKPSYVQIKTDTITRFWKKIVVDKLGIQKHQYALKHTGADDKILAGIDLDALRELYGHTSKYMTEKYARKIKEIYRKEILEKSPEF